MKHTLVNGVTGVSALTLGNIINRMPDIELWLRITSLFLGCVIGVITLFNLIRRGFK